MRRRPYFLSAFAAPSTIWSLDSTSEAGSDFGITCVSGTCAYDGGTCSSGNGVLDVATDTPTMLFTGNMASGCSGDEEGDMFEAAWDGTAWNVTTSGSCPEYVMLDRHDPGVIPLPNAEFKAYMHEGTTDFSVCYFDGSDWGDCVPIELAFDDGTTLGTVPTSPYLGECLGNIDAIVYTGAGGPYEGAFLKERDETQNPDPSLVVDCFTGGQGIVFAEHRN